jgi:hypothetical protein
VRTLIAGAAVVRRGSKKALSRRVLLHLVEDAHLGGDDEGAFVALEDVLENAPGASHVVRVAQDAGLAFRVGHHHRPRVLRLELHQALLAKNFVHHAAARPEHHVPACLFHHPAAQVLVRSEEKRPVLGRLFHNARGVGGGADDVAHGLYRRRAVDVRHHESPGVLGDEGPKSRGRAAVGEAAAGLQVRKQDQLLGI